MYKGFGEGWRYMFSKTCLLDHDLELCSSSFTFGRVRASSTLRSLNHDLFTITDVKALAWAIYALALEVVINAVRLKIEN